MAIDNPLPARETVRLSVEILDIGQRDWCAMRVDGGIARKTGVADATDATYLNDIVCVGL